MAEEVEDTTPKDETKNEPQTKQLTEEEVNKRIEAARKQEKDKLYGTIEALKETVESLAASAKKDQEAKEKAEADAKAKAEAEKQAKMSNEERLAEQMRRFEEQLAKEAAERARLESELRVEREGAELERYRQEVLRGESEIIPELVQGKSQADIDRSVARAKARYQELFQASKKKAEGPNSDVTSNMPGPTNPNPAALEEADLQKSIANFEIDPQRYHRDPKYKSEMDAKRKEILNNIGGAYQRASGR